MPSQSRSAGSSSKASARGRSQARHHRGAGRDKTIFTDSSRDYGKPDSAIDDGAEAELIDSGCYYGEDSAISAC